MNQRKITVNLIWANVFGVILFLVVTILSCSTWYFMWGYPTLDDFRVNSFLGHNAFLAALFILMLFIMGAIVHELIHGITWACFATNKFRSIHYGIIWGVLTPYCHCDEPLTPIFHRGLDAVVRLGSYSIGSGLSFQEYTTPRLGDNVCFGCRG